MNYFRVRDMKREKFTEVYVAVHQGAYALLKVRKPERYFVTR